jgi:hypothetical protein
MGKFKYNIKEEIKKPKDISPSLISRLEKIYGPIKDTDFFSDNLDTYFKTDKIDDETGGVSHKIIKLASFGNSLEKISSAVESLDLLKITKDVKDDQTIQEIASELKAILNKYRANLRKNYPDQYKQIKSTLREISTTGGGVGASSFTPGVGMQYSTPYAFKDKSSKIYKKGVNESIGATLGPGPKADKDGIKDNIYIKNFKYKLVPKNISKSGLETKQLFENELAKDFQEKRINSFNEIEQQLNDIYKLLSNAKNETAQYYMDNPSSYDIVKPTDLVLDYIKDIKTLLTEQ